MSSAIRLLLVEIVSVKLLPYVVSEVGVLVMISEPKGILTLRCQCMQIDLFGQEVEEDVNVTTDCCHVQICIVLWLFLIAIGTPVDKLLDALVGTVEDCQAHDAVFTPVEHLAEDVNTLTRVVMQKDNHVYVVIDYRIVKWTERALIQLLNVCAVFE